MGKLIDNIKKRLYEWCKPDTPPIEPLKIERVDVELKHYKACKRVSKKMIDNIDPEIVEHEVIRALMNELEPVIRNNIISERDYYKLQEVYQVDVWLKQ